MSRVANMNPDVTRPYSSALNITTSVLVPVVDSCLTVIGHSWADDLF